MTTKNTSDPDKSTFGGEGGQKLGKTCKGKRMGSSLDLCCEKGAKKWTSDKRECGPRRGLLGSGVSGDPAEREG